MARAGDIVRAIPSRAARAGLSWAKGTTSIGRPARIASPVVPIPPWWTIAAAWGNSRPNGTYSRTIAPAGAVRGRVTKAADAPGPLWVVAFSATGLQYETRVEPDGTFVLDGVYPGEYGVKVASEAVGDTEVPPFEDPDLTDEQRRAMFRVPNDPWKRAVKVTVEPGGTVADLTLTFQP